MLIQLKAVIRSCSSPYNYQLCGDIYWTVSRPAEHSVWRFYTYLHIRDKRIYCGHSTVGIKLLADQTLFILGHSLFDLHRWTFIIGPSSWDNQFQTFWTFIYVGILHHIKSLHGLLLRTISELAIIFIDRKSTTLYPYTSAIIRKIFIRFMCIVNLHIILVSYT